MKRRILVVTPYLPWPADFGGALRIYHLVRELSKEHDVSLVAPARKAEYPSVTALGEMCDVTAVPARWTFRQPAGRGKRLLQLRSLLDRRAFLERVTWNPQFQAVIDRLFLTRTIDLVQYEFPQLALFRPPRPCPTVIDSMDIQHTLLRRVAQTSHSLMPRMFNTLEWRKVRQLEERAWRQATINVATSQVDADVIAATTHAPALVVPNGVDVAAFEPLRSVPRRPHHAVFVGAMRHQPNAAGARWYVEHVHPIVRASIPDATLTIVGADPPPEVNALASESVTVTGHVDDVRPYLAEASVAVAPLHSGGGTRLKILEAFAAGIPVVSTMIGAEGLDVHDEQNILLADEPAPFARCVARVLEDRDLTTALVTSGLNTVGTQYDWTTVAGRLVAAHDLAIERFNQSNRSPAGSEANR